MDVRQRGLLVALRVWWWALATVGAAMYVVALPAAFRELASGARAELAEPSSWRDAVDRAGWDTRVVAGVLLGMLVAYTVAAVGASIVVHVRRPAEPAALFVATILLAHGLGWPQVLDSLGGRWMVWDAAGFVIAVYGFCGFFVLAFVFPDGRFVPPWTRWLAAGFVIETSLASAGLSPASLLPAPLGAVADSALGVVIVAAMIHAVVHRYRRVSTPAERRQTRGVGLVVLVLATCFVATGVLARFAPTGGPSVLWVELLGMSLFTLGFAVLPVAVAAAVLRRGLWETPPVLRGALVVTTVTAALVVAYVAVVAGATVLFDGGGPAATTVAALVVALAVDPVRRATTGWVERITLGDRADAGAAVVRLARRLDEARDPQAALPAVLLALREAVRSPGAAIVGPDLSMVDGRPPGPDSWRHPLHHGGALLGELALEQRGEEEFDATDRRLLEQLVPAVALALHAARQHTAATRLATELQASRESIVVAREEERRRLRRDLHDGLGPVLAGQVLRLETARTLLERDPHRAGELLDRAVAEAADSVCEVRRVVDGLRPPTLDDDGLAQAIRHRVRQLSDSAEVAVPDHLPRLRAAVEVACYHIVGEAVTNTVRHVPGARVRVELDVDDGNLIVMVSDDGPGLVVGRSAERTGAGLTTMRERAAELGGSLTVDSDDHGTRVRARLPLKESDHPGLHAMPIRVEVET